MSIRNELLEKILLAVETGTSDPQIVTEVSTVYQVANPTLNTVVDTGITPAQLGNNVDLAFTSLVQVTASSNIYALSNRVNKQILIDFPNIRYSRTSEFEGAGGDVFSAFWYDDASDTFKYEIDSDGGGKDVIQAVISEVELTIQAG